MNILAINNLQINNPFRKNETTKLNSSNRFGLTMAKPLLNDTVSFQAGKESIHKVVKTGLTKSTKPQSSGITLIDVYEASEIKKEPRLLEAANIFLDVLAAVAKKLEPLGVSFDREYCEKSPVKSIESKISKLLRSKSFDIRDGGVRATLYCKNINNLSILNDHILPEMKARGFKLDNINIPLEDAIEKGYIPKAKNKKANPFVSMLDLDIRLANAGKEKEKLDPEYRYYIGKPQKSGYEDIQMRFKKGKILYELIILCGPEYSKAKEFESHEIYSYLRKFDEMNILRNFKENDEHSVLADRYSTMIKNLIRGEFSQKLFENAKNKDIYGITEEIPIGLGDDDKKSLDKLFKLMYNEINAFYDTFLGNVRGYSFVRNRFEEEFKNDIHLLEEIEHGLKQTVEIFDNKKPVSAPKSTKTKS